MTHSSESQMHCTSAPWHLKSTSSAISFVLQSVRSKTEMPEARLLAAACSQLDPILSTDLKLLELTPSLQKLYNQPQR